MVWCKRYNSWSLNILKLIKSNFSQAILKKYLSSNQVTSENSMFLDNPDYHMGIRKLNLSLLQVMKL